MPIYGAWEMPADGPAMNKAEKARMGDFIRFLAEIQRGYFARRVAELREASFRGVTVTTAGVSHNVGHPGSGKGRLLGPSVYSGLRRPPCPTLWRSPLLRQRALGLVHKQVPLPAYPKGSDGGEWEARTPSNLPPGVRRDLCRDEPLLLDLGASWAPTR
jgi:hypothetical protein